MANPLTVTTIISSVLLYLLLPPLLDGIERKIKADIQSRYGPPTILQTWYDILKLMSKEVVVPMNPMFFAIPLALSFTLLLILSILLSQMVILMNINVVRIALILIILASTHVLNMFFSLFSSNPFSIIGVFRFTILNILNEVGLTVFLVLMFIILTGLSSSIILLLITVIPFTIAVYVFQGRLPYDLHEAEPELASGFMIEFSGPVLGLYLYLHLVERYLLSSLPIAFILYMAKTYLNTITAMIALHVVSSVLYIVFAIVSVILGRSRVNIAVKTLALLYFLAIAIWVGVYIIENIS